PGIHDHGQLQVSGAGVHGFRVRGLAPAPRNDIARRRSKALLAYLVRRFLLMLLTLFGISVIIFALLRLVPGNIADILFDSAGLINTAEKAQIERELGLDKTIPVQYAYWFCVLCYCDLGIYYDYVQYDLK